MAVMQKLVHQPLAWSKVLLILLSVLVFVACDSPDPHATSPKPEVASTTVPYKANSAPEIARDFTLQSLDGDSVTLGELKGQWVLVNFWATWCPPCVKEMPYLQRLSEERELVVLGVNYKEKDEPVLEFVKDNEITFPILMNPDDMTILFYKARSLPRTHVIDPDGNVALSIIGEIQSEQFDEWLDEQGVPLR